MSPNIRFSNIYIIIICFINVNSYDKIYQNNLNPGVNGYE